MKKRFPKSTKSARRAAMEDMKKAEVSTNYFNVENLVCNQPIITQRVGLLGLN